ncbi:MAG TPA: HemK family protein methyltransferase, partial [Reyranellaceae bacterium]|nr:HemK family protein methyltransferase [Reyranellaceae bacterium]
MLVDGVLPIATDVRRVLDLCTGSGSLAILTALTFPKARVDATDLSAPALALAKENVKAHRLGRRITLRHGDLFEPVRGRRYDLIISNPPYVDGRAMKALPREYRHEPRAALAAGRDGLDLVRRLMAEAAEHLTPDGALLCEIGRGRPRLEKAYPKTPFMWLDTEQSTGEVFWLDAKDF